MTSEAITLFPDQLDLFQRVRERMRYTKRILVQAETGFGKTIMGASMIAGSRDKGATAFFNVPRRELLKQTVKTLNEYRMPHSHIAAGESMNKFSQTFLTTTGTLVRRLDKVPTPRVVFLDEAHYAGETNKRIADHFHKLGAWIIGLTATPQYPNGDGMGDCYDEMVCGPSMRWLIDNKRLSDYRVFAPSRPDLSGIKKVAGDYARGQLADYMESERVLIGDAVRHYKTHSMGKLAIAYCTGVKHSQMVAEDFRNNGIAASHVDGDTEDDVLKKIIQAFARREIKVLTCADLLLFGFDLSAASGMNVTVETMVDLRPTQSVTLQRQKWGRALRYKDYPADIFDHAGNAYIHGLPDDEIKWTLDADQHSTGISGGGKAMQHCPKCFFMDMPRPVCPNCGYVYPVKPVESRMVDHLDGELTELSRDRRPMTPVEEELMKERVRKAAEGAIAKGVPEWRAYKWAKETVRAKMGVEMQVSLVLGDREEKL